MENQQNNISPQAMLSAIVGMMFFAPFIKNNVDNEPNFSPEERDFITSYINVWYANLALFIIVVLATLLNIFWIHPILLRISTVGSIAIYIITVFSLFACVNNLTMRKSDETLTTNIQHKWQLVKVYLPVRNFILWFRQENYNMPYRWLKESILLRTVFIFWTLLLWNSFWIWAFGVIVVRVVLLMMNIDIIPLSMKKAINSLFLCNPWEISAYIFAPIVSKIKKADYTTVLQAKKQSYAQWQIFWIWIIIQYTAFIAALYFIYQNIVEEITWVHIVLAIAAVLWIVRVILFFRYKKSFLKIPIISEIVSLVFH